MAHGKQGHIDAHILHAVQEENDPRQEQEMVITDHHVLGAQVDR